MTRPDNRPGRPLTWVLAGALIVAIAVGSVLVWRSRPVSVFDPAGAPVVATVTSLPPQVRIDVEVTSDLVSPWGLAFLPDGSGLVSERDTGRILRVPADGGDAMVVGTVDGVAQRGEGGLLGIAVPPGPEPTAVFAYTTTRTDNRIVRLEWDGSALGEQVPILTGIPANTFHNGGRLLALPDGSLLASTGDAGVPQSAQDLDSLAGKILHITQDGRPAPGNPLPDSPILTLGHRNVQGLSLDSEGRLWASEFGQNDADELNLIVPGGNYGWPIHEGGAPDPAYRNPAAQWSPTSTASPSGIAIVDDAVYVASLRGQTLWQVPLVGEAAAAPVALPLGDLGRLRTVAEAPDGSLWLVTSNTDGRGSPRSRDDRILRLTVG